MERCANLAFLFVERKQRRRVLKKALNPGSKLIIRSEPKKNKISHKCRKIANKARMTNQKPPLSCLNAQGVQSIPIKTNTTLNSVREEIPPPLPLPRSGTAQEASNQSTMHQCGNPQILPPLPTSTHLGNTGLCQAPGTCTLPRRSVLRSDQVSRIRSPSNPPPNTRHPPPYSRHQPPPPPRISSEHTQHRLSQEQHHYQTLQQQNTHFPYRQNGEFSSDQPLDRWKESPNSWLLTDHDSGFESLKNRSNEGTGPRSLETVVPPCKQPTFPSIPVRDTVHVTAVVPSRSTEDLLNASRVTNLSKYNLQHTGKSVGLDGQLHPQKMNETLFSDSAYPRDLVSSNKCDQISDSQKNNSLKRRNGFVMTKEQESRRNPLIPSSSQEQSTFKPARDTQRICKNDIKESIEKTKVDLRDIGDVHNHLRESITKETQTDASQSRHINGLLCHSNYVNENELYITEDNDNQKRERNETCSSDIEKYQRNGINKDTKLNLHEPNERLFNGGGVNSFVVRDYQKSSEENYQSSEEGERKVNLHRQLERDEGRRGDGCTAAANTTSTSWMEWTQQLQAYVAWVNSQLRKQPEKQLITDLRRDFQSGVVFADLIEIIAGEKVAGIVRGAEIPQLWKENLDRVLQFMAAKRIRMTHITSKEISEGNLKSIMRVILALAAHYKPQSVRDGNAVDNATIQRNPDGQPSQQSQIGAQPLVQESEHYHEQKTYFHSYQSSSKSVTHDVGVGPDLALVAPDKTPNLVRRNMAMINGNEEASGLPLRRNPSLTHTSRSHSPSPPVYENLPQRSAQNRWAYDSLRASHKFFWGAASNAENTDGAKTATTAHSLNDTSDDVLSSLFNTASSRCSSLNTSTDGDCERARDILVSLDVSPSNKPAALEFWQELQSSKRPSSTSKLVLEDNERDNPFRYHTIHRMSGRRKLPQIPGQSSSPSSNNSRGGTPLGSNASASSSDQSQGNNSLADATHSMNIANINRNTTNNDDNSREPEGRSQNSSPANSLVQGPVVESWQDLVGLSKSLNEIKDQFKDHLKNQDQLSSRQKTQFPFRSGVKEGVDVSDRGVCTLNSAALVSNVVGLHENLTSSNSLFDLRALSASLEGTLDARSYRNHSNSSHHHVLTHQKEMKGSKRWRLSSRFKFKECGGEGAANSNDIISENSASSLRQEVLRHIIARRTLENEKAELSRNIAKKDSLICDLRKQMIQKEKAFHLQRNHFEETIRNIQSGKPYRPFRVESPMGRNHGGREELQLVRDAISALRGNFRGTDPNQHTLDTLEQAIAVLIERSSLNFTLTANGDLMNGTNAKKEKRSTNTLNESYTKVIYFTDRTVTPFMTSINKRLGEITLRDFRNLFDRPGSFRFHFKSHDPEYGLVKEEIMADEDTLPGVDGKIIAWVEEDLE